MTSFLLSPQLASKRVGVRNVLGVSEAGLSTYSMHTVSAECMYLYAHPKGRKAATLFRSRRFLSPLSGTHFSQM